MATITSGSHTFEIVESVPRRYQIWNIGKNMIIGYLPLAEVDANYHVNPDTLKAIRIDGAQTILAAIGGGQNTIESMERYVKQYEHAKPNTWSYRQVQRMKAALVYMYQIKWD